MTRSSRTVLVLLLITAISLAAGCAPKAAVKGIQIAAMVDSSPDWSSPEYDMLRFVWDIGQSTLQSSGTPAFHVNSSSGFEPQWSSGSPLLVVQHWAEEKTSASTTELVTTTSKDVSILIPPEGARYSPLTGEPPARCRWYTPEDNAFLTVPQLLSSYPSAKTLDGTTVTITEYPLAVGSKTQTLTVPVPSGLTFVEVLYGSGSMTTGFVLVRALKADVNLDASTWDASILLLRINNGKATWIQCGQVAESDGSDQSPSRARVGTLVYFTHSHEKIACIDTAASLPTITWPKRINTLLDGFQKQKRANASQLILPRLASDSGLLIIGYPDVDWKQHYYAVDATGTVLGSLSVSGTYIECFDAKGKARDYLQFKGMQQDIPCFPSIDLFESYF
jgi:hypothetical protein